MGVSLNQPVTLRPRLCGYVGVTLDAHRPNPIENRALEHPILIEILERRNVACFLAR